MVGAMEQAGGDLVVLGGGPAGAVSAILGLRDGLRVTLVSPAPVPARAGRLEGLSPRLHQWLAREGLLNGFDGITGPLPRRVDWAGISGSNREFVVDRAALDAHLCALAEARGARRVTGTGRIAGRGGGSCESAKRSVLLSDGRRVFPDWIIDARGRSAPRMASGAASLGRMPATVALCGWLEGDVSGVEAGIALCALPQGWLWRVALPDGRIWAQFLGDAADPEPAPARLVAAIAAGTRCAPAPTLRLAGPLIAREAAPRLPAPVTDLRCLPVGDAFAAMDPLSGHGQFWAVSSALAAAAARRTLTADPASEDRCLRYLRERAAETAWRMARVGRDFLALETRFSGQPFWAARRALPDSLPAHESREGFAVAQALVIENGLITEREVLKTPRSPAGIGWFGRLPAPEIYRLAQAGPEALRQRFGPQAEALLAAIESERASPHQRVENPT